MVLYNFVIRVYGLAIRLAAFRKLKAKQWVEGRRDWKRRYAGTISALGPGKNIWVHCASYGEFEQARPLIKALKEQRPGYRIILTFFSPSGYEAFRDWNGADAIFYLPLDTRQNAAEFIRIVKPQVALFVKYEFWLNFLSELSAQKIPAYLVSGIFRPHQPFFKWYGRIFRKSLRTFRALLVQDHLSGTLLERIQIRNYKVCGDTRFDRVLEIRHNFQEIAALKDFKGNEKLLIAGSTWPGDEELLLEAFTRLNREGTKLVLVPHEIGSEKISDTLKRVRQHGLSSSLFTEGVDPASRVLILNTVGMLSRVYFYADAAYIGGGFNGGLHNCLEAAVYGVPVTFYGNQYLNYNEAVELKKIGAAVNVKDAGELYKALNDYLNDREKRRKVTDALTVFFEANAHSTSRTLQAIEW